jgi:transporter family-2 protein
MEYERRVAMFSLLPLILIAAIGGIAVALQAQFMGLMDKGIGTLESMFITYGSGGLLIVIAMLVNRGGSLSAWRGVPWYSLTAGLLGLIIVGTIGYSTPRLGLVPALTILVASQFIVGALLDHYGILGAALRPLTLTRLVGIGTMLFGVWLIIR